jgi:hypothetical protein
MSDKNTPNADQIRVRAYEIYLARGGEDGRDLSDWVEAERELSGLIEPLRTGTQKSRSAVAGQTR